MKWPASVVALALFSATGFGQEPVAGPPSSIPLVPAPQAGFAVPLENSGPALFPDDGAAESPTGRFTSNRNFSNFIGFLSNPLQNIDPRSLTHRPIFHRPDANTIPAAQRQHAGVRGGPERGPHGPPVLGLNQGGYATADLSTNRPGLFRDRFGILHDRRDFGGEGEGWLNLGGFIQYTLIQDVPNQFLLTAGLRLEVPSGSSAGSRGSARRTWPRT